MSLLIYTTWYSSGAGSYGSGLAGGLSAGAGAYGGGYGGGYAGGYGGGGSSATKAVSASTSPEFFNDIFNASNPKLTSIHVIKWSSFADSHFNAGSSKQLAEWNTGRNQWIICCQQVS